MKNFSIFSTDQMIGYSKDYDISESYLINYNVKSSTIKMLQKIRNRLAPLDPNSTFKSRSQKVSTWVGILVGTLTTVFILLLLVSKLIQVFNYESVDVQGYQIATRSNLTIISSQNETIGFGLLVKLYLNGLMIVEPESMYRFGLNATFCNTYLNERKCYPMKPAENNWGLTIDPKIKNFTISQLQYGKDQWFIGIIKCSKFQSTKCNTSYTFKSIKAQLYYNRQYYNMFAKNIDLQQIDTMQYQVQRILSTQKCKFINIFIEEITISTDYSILPSFLPKQREQKQITRIQSSQTLIGVDNTPMPQSCGKFLYEYCYLAIIISRSDKKWVYYRSFRKIDNVIAQIFGISSLIFLIWRILLSDYNEWTKNKYYFKNIENCLSSDPNSNNHQAGIKQYIKNPFRTKQQKNKQKLLLQLLEQATNPSQIIVKNAKLQLRIQKLQNLCYQLSQEILKKQTTVGEHTNRQLNEMSDQFNNGSKVYADKEQILKLIDLESQQQKKYKKESEAGKQSLLTNTLLTNQQKIGSE